MKTIAILLIICTLVVCVSSCNQPTPPDNEDNTSVTSQNADASDTPTNSQSTSDDQSPDNNEAASALVLKFDDYSDFMTFGTKGELDPTKYKNADTLSRMYKFDPNKFVDIKSLLNLPDASTKGWSERIVIQKSNEFTYYVSSANESNTVKTEYSVFVKFREPTSEKKTYAASIIPITKMSDMTGKSGSFVYKGDTWDVGFYKPNNGYKFLSLMSNEMSIQLIFGEDELTEAQISEKFGKVVAGFFSNDTAKVDKALNEMSSAVSAAQKNANK